MAQSKEIGFLVDVVFKLEREHFFKYPWKGQHSLDVFSNL